MLRLVSGLVSVYAFLCFIKRFRFLRLGVADFSAAVGICVLYAISAVLRNMMYTGHFSLIGILITIISMAWRLVFDIFVFVWIILIVRLVFMLLRKDHSPVFYQIDSSLSRFVFKISGIFRGGRPTSLKTALVITIIFLLAAFFVCNQLIGLLIGLLESAGGLSFRRGVYPTSGSVGTVSGV